MFLIFFPALLVFIGVLLFSIATIAFYVKQTISFTRLRQVFERQPGLGGIRTSTVMDCVPPMRSNSSNC